MKKIIQELHFERSTKGTHLFKAAEDAESPAISALYIRKSSMKKPPESIKIIIKDAGEV